MMRFSDYFLIMKVKTFLRLTPLLVLPSIILYFLGYSRLAVISLSLIPAGYFIWQIYLLLAWQGQTVRELESNMTRDERQMYLKTAKPHWRWSGAVSGLFYGATWFVLYSILGVRDYAYYVLIYLFLLMANHLLFILTSRRILTGFLLTTEYARRKGYDRCARKRRRGRVYTFTGHHVVLQDLPDL